MRMRQNQEGAVLIVALLLLLVTTFIGFSAMEGSNLESKMATAREVKELTFQSAEAMIEITLDNQPILGTAYARSLMDMEDTGWPGWPTATHSFPYNSYVAADTEVRFQSTAQTVGYSIRKGAAGIATYYYEVEGNSTRANTNISSSHTQGIFVEGPSL